MGFWSDFGNGFDASKWQTPGGGFGQAGTDLGNALGLSGGSVAGPDASQFNPDFSLSMEDRGNQVQLLDLLQAAAAGKGPSLVQSQLQQATDQNIKQALAFSQTQAANGGPGGVAGIGNVLQAQAGAQQEAAGQSAFLKNAEQLQARQQLAQLLQGMRSGDYNQALAKLQAQMGLQQMMQSAAQFNSQLKQQQIGRLWSIFGGGMNGAANASTVFGNNSPVGGSAGGGSMFSNLFGGGSSAGAADAGGTAGSADLSAAGAAALA